jgi:hypothetical protein
MDERSIRILVSQGVSFLHFSRGDIIDLKEYYLLKNWLLKRNGMMIESGKALLVLLGEEAT